MNQTRLIFQDLSQKKISHLFWLYALPAIVGSTISTLYNIIDGVFVGHWVGKEALTGLGVILPVMTLAAAVGMLVGAGSASRISICLGSNDFATAEKIAGTSFVLSIVLSGMTVITLFIFLQPILMFVGASQSTYPYARDFLQVFLPGSLFLTLCFNFNNIMRACGYPLKAMFTMLISVIANIILAPIFILLLDWGMRGVALATTISMFISLIFVMQHFINKKSPIRLKTSLMKLDIPTIKSIISIGLPPFFIQVSIAIIVFLVNFQLRHYAQGANVLSDDAIAGFSNANRLITLLVMIVIGLTQGMQPIIGYNYGAKNFSRVKQTLVYAIKVATIITTSGFLLGFFMPDTLVKIFTPDPEIIHLSATAFRYITLAFSVVGFQIVVSSFFQCIGMVKQSVFLSLSRQVVFYIPTVIILPLFLGLNGVWLASPVADLLATGVATYLLIRQLRSFKIKESTIRTTTQP